MFFLQGWSSSGPDILRWAGCSYEPTAGWEGRVRGAAAAREGTVLPTYPLLQRRSHATVSFLQVQACPPQEDRRQPAQRDGVRFWTTPAPCPACDHWWLCLIPTMFSSLRSPLPTIDDTLSESRQCVDILTSLPTYFVGSKLLWEGLSSL